MTPCVWSTCGFHPTILPSSVAKMNEDGLPGAALKNEVPLKMTPVAVPPALPPGAGMVTFRAIGPPLPLYSVERPDALSATQNGLVGEATMPQGFTSAGSTRSAAPCKSETRLCCTY